MIVDAETLELSNAIEQLLEETDDGQIKPELMESVCEIATDPLPHRRRGGRGAARPAPPRLRAGRAARACRSARPGTHPFAMWEDQRIVARPRYRDLIEALRFVARQELIFGMHVHVGLDDPEKADPRRQRDARPPRRPARAVAPTRRSGAGDATGLMSARTPIFRAVPARRRPAGLRRLGRLRRSGSSFMVDSGVMEDYTYLWYDVRPHPKLGHGRDPRLRLADAGRAHARARRAHPGDGQGAGRALRRRRAALRLPVGDARREQVDRRPPRARRRARSTCPTQRARPDEGARAGACSTGCVDHARDLGCGRPLRGARGPPGPRQRGPPPARRLRGQPRPARGHGRDRRGDAPRGADASHPRPALSSVGHGQLARALRRLQELQLAGQPVHHRVPVLRHAAAQARAEDRARGRRGRSRSAAAASTPSLGPLRTGEIPGIRGDELRRPVATMALVAIGLLWWLAVIPLRDEGFRLVLDPLGEWWQVAHCAVHPPQRLVPVRRARRGRRLRLAARAAQRPARRDRDLAARRDRRHGRRQGGRGRRRRDGRHRRRARAAVRLGACRRCSSGAARATTTTTSTCSAPP